MFLNFFFALKAKGVPVTLTEWLTFTEALARGYHQGSLTTFYYLGRALLVKSENRYDHYDQAFQQVFQGITTPDPLTEQILDWLKDPLATLPRLSPEELAAFPRHDLEELRRLFEERLREQQERHDGGSRWIGTGGTSPFGHGGVHPGGLRVGGEGGGRSAMQIAGERHFRNYRSDFTLDIRQLQVALRRLRRLSQVGPEDELDLDGTIDRTCRNAGEIELLFQRRRKNQVKVLLLMDVGGSMTPHAQLVGRLFSAANSASHFKDFQHFYFHNCIYDKLYRDIETRLSLPTDQLLRQLDADTKVILVGDACMYPGELFSAGGAIDYYYYNREVGIVWLQRLADHFSDAIWLNPDPRSYWGHPTVTAIGRIFPMFEMTVDGLDAAIRKLIAKAVH